MKSKVMLRAPTLRALALRAPTLCALALCAALWMAAGPGPHAAAAATPVADDPLPVLTSFPIKEGNPLFVAAASPREVWFTLPAENQVGRLTVSITGTAQVDLFPIPTAHAGLYDIAVGGGYAWFSEAAAGKIGLVNTATGAVSEIPLPTGSQPRRLAVLAQAGNPTHVWYADRAGDRLGAVSVTSPTGYVSTTYPLPPDKAGAQLEGVALQGANTVWFTAPGLHEIGRLTPDGPDPNNRFDAWTLVGGRPWSLAVDAQDSASVWFTEPDTDRVGRYRIGTLSLVTWWPLAAGSGPFDLALANDHVFFTEALAGRVGWGAVNSLAPAQRHFPGGRPQGIALDANGCGWVAQSNPGALTRWCAPYIVYTSRAYLPLLMKP